MVQTALVSIWGAPFWNVTFMQTLRVLQNFRLLQNFRRKSDILKSSEIPEFQTFPKYQTCNIGICTKCTGKTKYQTSVEFQTKGWYFKNVWNSRISDISNISDFYYAFTLKYGWLSDMWCPSGTWTNGHQTSLHYPQTNWHFLRAS